LIPLDFTLTEDQRQVRDLAHRVAEKLKPAGGKADGDSVSGVPEPLAELNLLGMTVPEEFGGGGKDPVSFVLSLMEVSRISASVAALAAANHSFYCFPLRTYGNTEQKTRYLQPCGSGEKVGSYALLENDFGLDPVQITTRAIKEQRGWSIQGVKRFVPHGAASAFCIVSALESAGHKNQGLSSFVMDLREGRGSRIGRSENGFNILALSSAEIIFESTPVKEDSLLGSPGQGTDHRSSIQRESWLSIAALAVGIGRGAFEKTVEIVTKREGRKGGPSDQVVQWKFADMAVSLDAAELLTLRAAWLEDQGKPHEREVAMARMFASNAAMAASTECIQIVGEYCREPSLEDHLRKAKMCQVSMGTNERAGVLVARNLTKGK
jgi:alkylation response protein AidB-like acyl-CoA dehydrogenase